jgi:hypothetical protein
VTLTQARPVSTLFLFTFANLRIWPALTGDRRLDVVRMYAKKSFIA